MEHGCEIRRTAMKKLLNWKVAVAGATVFLGVAGVGVYISPERNEERLGTESIHPEVRAKQNTEGLTNSEPTNSKLVLAVEPKPLTDNVHRGLKWLKVRQHENGGWGPGHGDKNEVPDVANTCVAVQAYTRAGNRPDKGTYQNEMKRAIDFIVTSIEKSDQESLFITDNRSTQVQRKLGTYVDTFMAATVLAEVKGRMGSEKENKRVDAALGKVLAKMEAHQQEDGTWKNSGWAPKLANSYAVKGLNRAYQAGANVPAQVMKKAEEKSKADFDGATGRFSSSGSAGVELYGVSSGLTELQDRFNSNESRRRELETAFAKAPPLAKPKLQQELREMDELEDALDGARNAAIQRTKDPRFIAGFGNNGGEEFLSYLNIGESLFVKGGEDWKNWDTAISESMSRTQDPDGSWKGKHCITGGTFCTSTALLVLMTDRTPVPQAVVKSRNE